MTTTGQDHDLYVGEVVDITVTLTGVTLTGSETITAYWRKRETNELELSKVGTIDDNGPPAVVVFALDEDDTELVTVASRGSASSSHVFSVWRTDAGTETPYALGNVTVRHTARTGL